MLPQLSLTAPQSSDRLKEECTDLLLSPTDFEAPGRYHPRFPTLFKLMAGLLTIPCSNADAERGFSILNEHVVRKTQCVTFQFFLSRAV